MHFLTTAFHRTSDIRLRTHLDLMLSPIQLSLFKNSLESLVDEMALTIVRTAYSTTLKNAMDFSTGLCDKDGALIAQGLCIPLHLGSLPDGMDAILHKFAGDINEGDLFILNDPYEGGTHLPDIYLYKPVYVSGSLLGFLATIAHHADIGGRVAGGNACDSTEIFQEGLRIPPLKLYESGRPVKAIFDVIEKNVRVPRNVLGDLRAQLAACHIGEGVLKKIAREHGLKTLANGFDQLLEYSERLTRAEIAEFPDGTYTFTDHIDDDGIDPDPIPIVVTLNVSGDRFEADFTGTSPQVKGAINCTLSFTTSVVYGCLRSVMKADIPTNHGFFKALDIRVPSASLANPESPAPVAARGLTGMRLSNTVMGALAQMLPDTVPACEAGGETGISIAGYTKDRTPFAFIEFLLCGWGGRPDADGIDGCASIVVNTANNPVEVIEKDHPIQILKYEYVPNSGGVGKHRGALAIARSYRFTEDEGILQLRSDRTRFSPYGLSGGGPGALAHTTMISGGDPIELPSKTLLPIRQGDILHHNLTGGGGWGVPFQRDPDLVLHDVRNEKISLDSAYTDYGVSIDPNTWTIQENDTAKLRSRSTES